MLIKNQNKNKKSNKIKIKIKSSLKGEKVTIVVGIIVTNQIIYIYLKIFYIVFLRETSIWLFIILFNLASVLLYSSVLL